MQTWRRNIRKVSPYKAGEQPDFVDMIKLNTNENPYPPAPGVARMMKEESAEKLRLYPNTSAEPLRKELAAFYHLDEEQFFVGVGSDDVLGMSFLTFFNSEKPILFPDITYSFYDVWANLYHIPYIQPKLDENFRIRKEDYFVPNGGIVIANPNAPTSIAMEVEDIREIIEKNPDVIVIVDEAYVDFGAESMMPFINQYDNLLVVQTFSKSRSMAGMRIGYAVGNKELIQALNDVKNSYNSYTLSRSAIVLGTEAVKDSNYFYSILDKIITTRTYVADELKKIGFTVMDSSTNFLFISHPKMKAEQLFEALRDAHIYVRYWDKERIRQWLRVTIGTDDQMEQFLEFIRKYEGGSCENINYRR